MFALLLPIGILAAAAYSALTGVPTAGTLLVGATTLGLSNKKREYERNFRLGINPEYEKYQAEKALESLKNGVPVLPESESFGILKFDKGELPEKMRWLEEQTWLLTNKEFARLVAMLNRHMFDLEDGRFAEKTKSLCERLNISYRSVEDLVNGLVAHMDYDKMTGQPRCYDEYIWLSNNRLADPIIQQKLNESR